MRPGAGIAAVPAGQPELSAQGSTAAQDSMLVLPATKTVFQQEKGHEMKRIALILALLIAGFATQSQAGVSVDQSKVLDRWTLRIGGYLTGLDTKIRLDSPTGGEGTTVSLEDDLGFDSSQSVPRFSLGVILGQRHQITGGYYKTDRDSTTTLQRDIEWGDETFPINIDIGAFYNTEFVNLAYTYWFYSSESTSLGITGGLVYASLGAGAGIAAVGQGISVEEDISTDVPVPQLGFSVNQYLGKRFVFTGTLGYINFNLDDFDGSVATALVGVEHRTWNYFGFGLGYSYTDYDIDTLSTDFLGQWQYTVSGFEIYARAAW